MEWEKIYQKKRRTIEDAVKVIRSGDRIYIGTASSIAYKLAEGLYERKNELEDVVICHGLTPRLLPFFKPDAKGHFSTLTYFAGFGDHTGIKNGLTKYTSLHLSQVRLWCRDIARPNVAFLEVSPPDENGYMSYGAYGTAFHDYIRELAGTVILQVNKNAPRVFGESNRIHISQADYIVEADDDIFNLPNALFDDTTQKLASHILPLIPDGATLQLGIGALSNAIGFGLKNHTDLGIHTEMLTDSMMELIKSGVVTNKKKSFMPGRTVTSFAFGTSELYKYIHCNEDIYFAPYAFVNDPYIIAKNDNMISVNTAMSIDLYGQICADCLAGKQQSATGGQVDYVRGSQMSKGGKSIIAMTSTVSTKQGLRSRIVAALPPGSAVTTTRADVQYVATEYGCVNLKNLTMDDRARALISLAHPDFQDELKDQAKAIGLLS